jgi:serine/tyrosine/threonine adenylyltransferase
VGFAHGVMNTDNMSILGLTIDYGPYGFMDAYDPQFICNHTDEQGRYSFVNQPVIAHWNLRALALALSSLIPTDVLIEKLATFEEHFGGTYHGLMRAKLGLTREVEGDNALIGGLLALMARTKADYTLSFRNLTGADGDWLALFGAANSEAQAWLARYRARTQNEDLSGLNRINPKYVLRNWVAETVIRAVEDKNDVAVLDRIFKILQTPFETHDGDEVFAAPPPPEMCHLEVSCSS